MTLTVTEKGLAMTATLPDTERGRELHTAIKRGDIAQMSFMFDIAESEYNDQTKTRTVTKIGKVYEISAVTRAAYPQTKITARAEKQEEKEMFNPITASLERGVGTTDTHATPEYRTAFFKSLWERNSPTAKPAHIRRHRQKNAPTRSTRCQIRRRLSPCRP